MASETFAGRLCKLRERAGLTTYALAKKCGLSKQALYRLEEGKNEPAWQTVQLIAKALGLDCRAFVDPALVLPEDKPAASRGRPRKPAEAPPAAKKRKGKGA